jgi:hypothetical protein
MNGKSPTTEPMTIRVPARTVRQIEGLAGLLGSTRSSVATRLLEGALDQRLGGLAPDNDRTLAEAK